MTSRPDPAATALALTTLADAFNANASILNSLMFTYMDYAAVGYAHNAT